MTYGNYAIAHDDFLYGYQAKYGNPTRVHTTASSSSSSSASSSASANGVYASGISDAGLGKNTCTDGQNDGKIGIGSALLNAGEGIIKGAINGIKGMFTNKEGKFSLGKTLLSVGIAAACIAFPAVGAVACGIGAIAGGSQVIKGFKAQANATTDAEAKAAWENIGEGTSTVVGCALGAKASVGAMKGASTAAIDDVAKVASKALKNGDDITTGMLKGLDNVDEVAAALDDVTDAAKAAEVIKSTGKMKNASALSNVDDSLTGTKKLTETAKAFGKDAMSSTKNNGKALWAKTSKTYTTAKEVVEYKNAQRKYNKIDKTGALTDDEMRIIKEFEIRDTMVSDDAADVIARLDDMAQAGQNYKTVKKDFNTAKKAFNTAKKALNKATREVKKGGYEGNYTKAEQMAFDDATKALDDATKALDATKSKTSFGKLTNNVKGTKTYEYLKTTLKPDEAASAFKNIKNIKLKDVAGNLWGDGKKIFTALQENQNIQTVINEYGYDDVMQVLQVAYGYGLAEQTI